MSKTYKKFLRLNNACGSNTKFYRKRRKSLRRKSKQSLHKSGDDFVNPEELSVFKDTWREPTDGHWLADYKDIEREFANSRWIKLLHKLKPNEKKTNK